MTAQIDFRAWFSVLPYVFVGWLCIWFLRTNVSVFSNIQFFSAYYFLTIIITYGFSRFYFYRNNKAYVFDVAVSVVLWVLLLELIANLFSFSLVITYSYFGWIFPIFLVASIVYWVGKNRK